MKKRQVEFNLENAKRAMRGELKCTYKGCNVRIICTNAKIEDYPIVAMVSVPSPITNESGEWKCGREELKTFTVTGCYSTGETCKEDNLELWETVYEKGDYVILDWGNGDYQIGIYDKSRSDDGWEHSLLVSFCYDSDTKIENAGFLGFNIYERAEIRLATEKEREVLDKLIAKYGWHYSAEEQKIIFKPKVEKRGNEIGWIRKDGIEINPCLSSEEINHILVRCADILRARAENI